MPHTIGYIAGEFYCAACYGRLKQQDPEIFSSLEKVRSHKKYRLPSPLVCERCNRFWEWDGKQGWKEV